MNSTALIALTLFAVLSNLPSANAQTNLPARLRGKARCSVLGTVTAVNSSQIIVSNGVLRSYATTSTVWQRQLVYNNGNVVYMMRPTTVPGRDVQRVETNWTYLRNFPDWRSVQIGDKVNIGSDNCFLIGEAGGYRTCEYFRTPPVRRVRVWN